HRQGEKQDAEHDGEAPVLLDHGARFVFVDCARFGLAGLFSAKRSWHSIQPVRERAPSVAARPPFSTNASKPRSLKMYAAAELRRPVSQHTTYCTFLSKALSFRRMNNTEILARR